MIIGFSMCFNTCCEFGRFIRHLCGLSGCMWVDCGFSVDIVFDVTIVVGIGLCVVIVMLVGCGIALKW